MPPARSAAAEFRPIPAPDLDPIHDPGPSEAARRTEMLPEDVAAEPLRPPSGGTIRIGTASWTDPTMTARGVFYPDGADSAEERLGYYASRFPIVEVDATYYALPSRRTAELWVDRTPPDFIFDIKAHALMTGQPTETKRLPKDLKRRNHCHKTSSGTYGAVTALAADPTCASEYRLPDFPRGSGMSSPPDPGTSDDLGRSLAQGPAGGPMAGFRPRSTGRTVGERQAPGGRSRAPHARTRPPMSSARGARLHGWRRRTRLVVSPAPPMPIPSETGKEPLYWLGRRGQRAPHGRSVRPTTRARSTWC